jgi:hypothetical protein
MLDSSNVFVIDASQEVMTIMLAYIYAHLAGNLPRVSSRKFVLSQNFAYISYECYCRSPYSTIFFLFLPPHTLHQVIAWVGAKASVGERKYALRYAQEYVTQHNKNPATPVTRVLEGGENEVWNSLFE